MHARVYTTYSRTYDTRTRAHIIVRLVPRCTAARHETHHGHVLRHAMEHGYHERPTGTIHPHLSLRRGPRPTFAITFPTSLPISYLPDHPSNVPRPCPPHFPAFRPVFPFRCYRVQGRPIEGNFLELIASARPPEYDPTVPCRSASRSSFLPVDRRAAFSSFREVPRTPDAVPFSLLFSYPPLFSHFFVYRCAFHKPARGRKGRLRTRNERRGRMEIGSRETGSGTAGERLNWNFSRSVWIKKGILRSWGKYPRRKGLRSALREPLECSPVGFTIFCSDVVVEHWPAQNWIKFEEKEEEDRRCVVISPSKSSSPPCLSFRN